MVKRKAVPQELNIRRRRKRPKCHIDFKLSSVMSMGNSPSKEEMFCSLISYSALLMQIHSSVVMLIWLWMSHDPSGEHWTKRHAVLLSSCFPRSPLCLNHWLPFDWCTTRGVAIMLEERKKRSSAIRMTGCFIPRLYRAVTLSLTGILGVVTLFVCLFRQ